LELRDVRKMGYLGLWVDGRRNESRTEAGRLREEEAELRLRTFRQYGLLVCPVWGVEEAGSPMSFVGCV